jgi:fructosamine-3-kinase
MTPWLLISAAISDATRSRLKITGQHAVNGGCINKAYVLEGADQRYFVKLNRAEYAAMFEAEAAGLLALMESQTVRVPFPVCWGNAGDNSYLVLEYIEMNSPSPSCMAALGEQLAKLHRHTGNRYGWHRDNTIGSTPQINTPDSNWALFWRGRRLAYQLELAARKGYGGKLQREGERLLNEIDGYFQDYTPTPSLLHGDLWAGNHAMDENGRPMIFDPAVYYGDREADLAMTELFGGFSPPFYRAYEEAFPVDKGYVVRKPLYNLYHVLNHLNLFGGAYGAQAQRMMQSLLAEC